MSDLISIIIVNWNGKKWLEKCLSSLREQTYQNFEIIFVDNASTDDSIKYVKMNFSEVKIIESKENLGFAGGNNLGINKSKGEFVLLLNNDTWLDAKFLETAAPFLNKKNSSIILGPYEANYYNKRKHIIKNKIDIFGYSVFLNDLSKDFYITGSCLFFKKDYYLKTHGLDNNFFMYYEETDWQWRVWLFDGEIRRLENLFVYHAGVDRGINLSHNNFLWRNQNCLQMLLKNYKWFNLLWVIPIYILQNIAEMLLFCMLLKFDIASTYPKGWWFNIKNWPKIKKERKWVQENRVVGDWEIIKKMYWGFGKLKHLIDFIKNKYA